MFYKPCAGRIKVNFVRYSKWTEKCVNISSHMFTGHAPPQNWLLELPMIMVQSGAWNGAPLVVTILRTWRYLSVGWNDLVSWVQLVLTALCGYFLSAFRLSYRTRSVTGGTFLCLSRLFIWLITTSVVIVLKTLFTCSRCSACKIT